MQFRPFQEISYFWREEMFQQSFDTVQYFTSPQWKMKGWSSYYLCQVISYEINVLGSSASIWLDGNTKECCSLKKKFLSCFHFKEISYKRRIKVWLKKCLQIKQGTRKRIRFITQENKNNYITYNGRNFFMKGIKFR